MKNTPLLIGAVLVLGLLGYFAFRSNKVLVDGFPPKDASALTQREAYAKALTAADGDATRVGSVLGTGSMQPYIPVAAPGLDPYATVVAYVVYRKGATFADIRDGDLCAYRPARAPKPDPLTTTTAELRAKLSAVWLHQAAMKDGGGYIMTGYANKHYESWMRVTPENFIGIVERTFVWSR